MRLAIVGSRQYGKLEQVRDYVRQWAAAHPDGVIVSGGARGVDSTAEDEAKKCGLHVASWKPDWENLGRRAGMVRNHEIVNDADEIVAFWDGQSKGTAHTISIAKDYGKPITIIIERG